MISTEDITSSNTRATRLQLSVRVCVCARERAVDVSVGAHALGMQEGIVCVKMQGVCKDAGRDVKTIFIGSLSVFTH